MAAPNDRGRGDASTPTLHVPKGNDNVLEKAAAPLATSGCQSGHGGGAARADAYAVRVTVARPS